MNTIDTNSAKLAGLQIDLLQKIRSGHVSIEHLKWFNKLSKTQRDILSAADLSVLSDPAPTAKPAIDPIIRIDRSIKPTYPDWMKKVLYPELESVGPAEYDASSIEQWLHDGQKDGKWVTGNVVYGYLKYNDLLKSCHGLRDLEEIQKKGIEFFRKHFKGKAPTGWASVVQDRDGSLHVPYLCEDGDGVVLYWNWLGSRWDGDSPALRHAS